MRSGRSVLTWVRSLPLSPIGPFGLPLRLHVRTLVTCPYKPSTPLSVHATGDVGTSHVRLGGPNSPDPGGNFFSLRFDTHLETWTSSRFRASARRRLAHSLLST